MTVKRVLRGRMGNVDPVLNWQLWIRGGAGEVQERLRNHQPKQSGPSCLLFIIHEIGTILLAFRFWYLVFCIVYGSWTAQPL